MRNFSLRLRGVFKVIINFLEEKKVSIGLAVGSIVLGIITIAAWIGGMSYIGFTVTEGYGDYETYMGALAIAVIFGIISAIFQFAVMTNGRTL